MHPQLRFAVRATLVVVAWRSASEILERRQRSQSARRRASQPAPEDDLPAPPADRDGAEPAPGQVQPGDASAPGHPRGDVPERVLSRTRAAEQLPRRWMRVGAVKAACAVTGLLGLVASVTAVLQPVSTGATLLLAGGIIAIAGSLGGVVLAQRASPRAVPESPDVATVSARAGGSTGPVAGASSDGEAGDGGGTGPQRAGDGAGAGATPAGGPEADDLPPAEIPMRTTGEMLSLVARQVGTLPARAARRWD